MKVQKKEVQREVHRGGGGAQQVQRCRGAEIFVEVMMFVEVLRCLQLWYGMWCRGGFADCAPGHAEVQKRC